MTQDRPLKLVLNRDTLRNLTNQELDSVEGGKNKPYSAGPGATCPDTVFPCFTC